MRLGRHELFTHFHAAQREKTIILKVSLMHEGKTMVLVTFKGYHIPNDKAFQINRARRKSLEKV